MHLMTTFNLLLNKIFGFLLCLIAYPIDEVRRKLFEVNSSAVHGLASTRVGHWSLQIYFPVSCKGGGQDCFAFPRLN